MRDMTFRGRVVLLMLAALTISTGLIGLQPKVYSEESALPDLVPMGLSQFRVTQRLGGPTLEFGILTANIGGADFERPRDPNDPERYLLRQIYEYALFNEQDGEWVEINRRRKNTICTVDDTIAGSVFPCIQQHGAIFDCSPTNQGISQGWADDYFRGLEGQWVFLGDNTGRFKLEAILDPDGVLQREDLPDNSRDGNPDNNFADVYFTWDGRFGEIERIDLYFDPDSVCPLSN